MLTQSLSILYVAINVIAADPEVIVAPKDDWHLTAGRFDITFAGQLLGGKAGYYGRDRVEFTGMNSALSVSGLYWDEGSYFNAPSDSYESHAGSIDTRLFAGIGPGSKSVWSFFRIGPILYYDLPIDGADRFEAGGGAALVSPVTDWVDAQVMVSSTTRNRFRVDGVLDFHDPERYIIGTAWAGSRLSDDTETSGYGLGADLGLNVARLFTELDEASHLQLIIGAGVRHVEDQWVERPSDSEVREGFSVFFFLRLAILF